MKLAITVCATKKYCYAMKAQARRVQAACEGIETGNIILVGDDALKSIVEFYKSIMPKWDCEMLAFKNLPTIEKGYDGQAQLLIAQLRTAAFERARALDVDQCWSLDSDVLPPPNALKWMQHMLNFDDLYSISTCPYPSQGGGGFLGGRGTIYQPILPDFYEEEREIPDELKKDLAHNRAALEEAHKAKDQKKADEIGALLAELDKKVRECPSIGSVFTVNAKQWKKRGWFDNAYPALGFGAVVPSDWCGFGCTLMNKRALGLAHFDGYDGRGTEDLYICWNRWYPAGLKINCIPHCPCDHVIRNPGKPGFYIHCQARHETEGECVGHLRVQHRPWYSFDPGEIYNIENDGKFVPPPKPEEKPIVDNKT